MFNIHKSEVAFFGKITAGITHEMQNILGIINESSGLIEDLMAMTSETSPNHDRYQAALTKIKAQVRRGVELMKCLNHLAHCPDTPVKQLDLGITIKQLIDLSQRFARLKNVVLKTCPPSPSELPILIVSNSIQLQMALFAGIECWLSLGLCGNEINIYPLEKNDTCIIVLQCEGNFDEKNELDHHLTMVEHWPILHDILISLGGHVEINEAESSFSLFFPKVKQSKGPN